MPPDPDYYRRLDRYLTAAVVLLGAGSVAAPFLIRRWGVVMPVSVLLAAAGAMFVAISRNVARNEDTTTIAVLRRGIPECKAPRVILRDAMTRARDAIRRVLEFIRETFFFRKDDQ